MQSRTRHPREGVIPTTKAIDRPKGRAGRRFAPFALALALGAAAAPAQAGSGEAVVRAERGGASGGLASAGAALREASAEYRKSLEALIAIHEREAVSATEVLAQRRALYEQGIVSRRELEEAESALAGAKAKAEEARKQIGASEAAVAKAVEAERGAAISATGARRAMNAVIRSAGSAGWSLSNAAKVSSFFTGHFGRSLPVSAFGQSRTHDRLGYDHSHALDVALHPDSAEGQALIEYLRREGIPFLAFRAAIPGVSTGAHIHIGSPSHRL